MYVKEEGMELISAVWLVVWLSQEEEEEEDDDVIVKGHQHPFVGNSRLGRVVLLEVF